MMYLKQIQVLSHQRDLPLHIDRKESGVLNLLHTGTFLRTHEKMKKIQSNLGGLQLGSTLTGGVLLPRCSTLQEHHRLKSVISEGQRSSFTFFASIYELLHSKSSTPELEQTCRTWRRTRGSDLEGPTLLQSQTPQEALEVSLRQVKLHHLLPHEDHKQKDPTPPGKVDYRHRSHGGYKGPGWLVTTTLVPPPPIHPQEHGCMSEPPMTPSDPLSGNELVHCSRFLCSSLHQHLRLP